MRCINFPEASSTALTCASDKVVPLRENLLVAQNRRDIVVSLVGRHRFFPGGLDFRRGFVEAAAARSGAALATTGQGDGDRQEQTYPSCIMSFIHKACRTCPPTLLFVCKFQPPVGSPGARIGYPPVLAPVKRPEILQFRRLNVAVGKTDVDSAREGRAGRNAARRRSRALAAVARDAEPFHRHAVALRCRGFWRACRFP